MEERPAAWALAAAFAGAVGLAVVAVRFVSLPLDRLLVFVPDDAFYYLGIARHLARDGRPTFDGASRTNGYHPGWMVVCTALARALEDRVALLRAALVVAFGLHAATCVVLGLALRRLTGATWALASAAAWAVSPFPLTMAAQCVESSLYLLALAVLLSTYLADVAPHLDPGRVVPFGGLLRFGGRGDGGPLGGGGAGTPRR